MWISQENENQRRTQNPQQTAPHRPQAIKRLNKKFPKSARILSRSHFQALKQGRPLIGSAIILEYRQGRSLSPKLGITVSRRFGKAHKRNRFKRVVREAFRTLRPFLPEDLELNILPRKTFSDPSLLSVLIDLKGLLKKIV
jgi:ribonuclease P protein component